MLSVTSKFSNTFAFYLLIYLKLFYSNIIVLCKKEGNIRTPMADSHECMLKITTIL